MAGTDDCRSHRRGPWRGWATLVAVLGLLAVIAVGVATAPPAATDRADALASRLRCPVCQGVSVAESRSDTALAMQDRIRQMVEEGASDDEVLAHFTARYGRWVLLDPADSAGAGWLLWVLPGIAVVAGAAIVARRRRRPTPPTVDEQWRRAIRREVDRQRRKDAGRGPA